MEFPLTAFGEGLLTAARKLTGRPKWASVHAILGLKRAWRIAPIDPEMALFRAITAEEEAATALITALKIRRYPNAERLNHKDHGHKNGLYPFVRGIEIMFAESGWPSPTLRLQHEGRTPRIDVHIPSEAIGLAPGRQVTPNEPLNLTAHRIPSDSSERIVEDFSNQLQALAQGRGAKDIAEVIATEANLRNRLLYAADNGVPKVDNVDPELIARRKRILLLVGLTITILQTKAHQLFAVQAVQAYVGVLGRSAVAPYDFESAIGTPAEVTLSVTREPGGSLSTKIIRRFRPLNFVALDCQVLPTLSAVSKDRKWIEASVQPGAKTEDFTSRLPSFPLPRLREKASPFRGPYA